MFKIFPFIIGFRNFKSGNANSLASFISLLAVLGLTLGVALLILVMSIMNGFESEMESKILGSVPHIQIFKEGGVDNLSSLTQLIEADHNVRSTMPFSRIDGMLIKNGTSLPIELLGVEAAKSKDFIGSFASLDMLLSTKGDSFLLAKGVAKKLSAEVGDIVTLLAPQAESLGGFQFAPKIISFKVAGIFTTHTSLDQKLVLGPLKKVTEMIGFNAPQGVQIKVGNIFDARETGFRLIRTLPAGYRFSDWIQTHGNLYQAIKMSRKMVLLLVFFIIVAAVFNVVSMLIMTVMDKRSCIAILKTLGAKNSDIILIFLTQGFLIGAIGSLVGAVIGVCGALNAPLIASKLESFLGISFLNSEVYPIDFLPSKLIWGDVFLVVAVAMVLNLTVAIYPALQAAKVKPASELKYR